MSAPSSPSFSGTTNIEDKLVVGDVRDWTADIVTESIRFQEQFVGSTVTRAGPAVLHRPGTPVDAADVRSGWKPLQDWPP